jgi:hypothetical protein
MDFSVKVVPDCALPTGVKRVMVEVRGETAPVLLLKESVMDNWRFLQDWEQLYGAHKDEYCLRAV